MKASLERLLLRCIHLIFSIPIIALIYHPIHETTDVFIPIRWVFASVLMVSGLWIWNEPFIRKWLRSLRITEQV